VKRRADIGGAQADQFLVGSMRWRFLAASVCATETDSTKPMIEISTRDRRAGPEVGEKAGMVSGGRPLRHLAHDGHALRSRPSPQTSKVVTTTAPPARPWRDVGQPWVHAGDEQERLQPLAHPEQERRGARGPMASVIGLTRPGARTATVEDLGQVVARRLDAQDMLELAEGDQDARGGDEAGDHRVAEEIGEKAQPEDPMSRIRKHARQEGQRERGDA
jgi:hypothetical protein